MLTHYERSARCFFYHQRIKSADQIFSLLKKIWSALISDFIGTYSVIALPLQDLFCVFLMAEQARLDWLHLCQHFGFDHTGSELILQSTP